MKIILSPAKKMKTNQEAEVLTMPAFMENTKELMEWMQKLTYEEAKKLWGCNDKIAQQNYERFQNMELFKNLTPAILSYEGIAYQYMAPTVFEYGEFDYVQENLRILSAFYGVVKPMDGVTPYRLEMQAKAGVNGKKDLYDYWGDRLYKEVVDDSHVIINLASKEYSKCVEKYLQAEDTYITCIFGELSGEKVIQKGVYAKMARGEMVRFMAEKQVEDPQEIKKFDRLGYQFCEERSDKNQYIFLRGEIKQVYGRFSDSVII